MNYVQDQWNRTMEESAWCGIPFNKRDSSSQLLMVVSSCIFFVIPMTLILILYLRIALVLHRSSRNRSLRRCCASHHSPNIQASTASMAYPNNQVQSGNLMMSNNLVNNKTQTPPNIGSSSGRRCQAERAHIQSRRAVIRMLGEQDVFYLTSILFLSKCAHKYSKCNFFPKQLPSSLHSLCAGPLIKRNDSFLST